MVAVELQLRSDFLLLLHGKSDGVQYEIDRLCCSCFIRNNAIVEQIPNYREVKNTLTGMDVGDIRDSFVVWPVSLKLSVQQVFVLVKLLSHLSPLSASANFR